MQDANALRGAMPFLRRLRHRIPSFDRWLQTNTSATLNIERNLLSLWTALPTTKYLMLLLVIFNY